MIGETITLKEVLTYMDGKQPFSIKFITCDQHQDTGGEEIFIARCWKYDIKKEDGNRPLAGYGFTGVRRNPNHYQNSTRNLILPNSQIRKVHIRLIRQFNGKTVL